MEAARVWDKEAERFPVCKKEVERFGSKAKFLRPVVPSTTDLRSFVQVLKSDKMDHRFYGPREGREAWESRDMPRDARDGRGLCKHLGP